MRNTELCSKLKKKLFLDLNVIFWFNLARFHSHLFIYTHTLGHRLKLHLHEWTILWSWLIWQTISVVAVFRLKLHRHLRTRYIQRVLEDKDEFLLKTQEQTRLHCTQNNNSNYSAPFFFHNFICFLFFFFFKMPFGTNRLNFSEIIKFQKERKENIWKYIEAHIYRWGVAELMFFRILFQRGIWGERERMEQ